MAARGGVAAYGGVAAHGGVAARGGARTRSDQIRRVPDRPSVSEPIFSNTLTNVPSGEPLETPLHPKRVRVLPPVV